MSEGQVVVVDASAGPEVVVLRAAGMSLVERAVREARRAGASEILLRGSDEVARHLADLGLPVGLLPLAAPTPSGARVVHANEVAGRRVTDRESLRAAEWALLETCRRPYDGLADRYLWRAWSLRVTRLVSRTEITPNQVTVVAALCGLLGCFLVASTHPAGVVTGGLALLVGLVLDSVDGELARVRLRFSNFGMVLDNVSDDIVDTLFIAASGLAAGGGWRWLGLAAALARSVTALVIYDGARRLGKPGDVMAFRWWFDRDEDTTAVYGDPLAPLNVVRSFGRHDLYVTVFGIMAVADFPRGVVAYGAVLAAAYFAVTVGHLAHRARARAR